MVYGRLSSSRFHPIIVLTGASNGRPLRKPRSQGITAIISCQPQAAVSRPSLRLYHPER